MQTDIFIATCHLLGAVKAFRLELPDGRSSNRLARSFDVVFSMTARWPTGKSLQEYLFSDNGTFLQQIGPT